MPFTTIDLNYRNAKLSLISNHVPNKTLYLVLSFKEFIFSNVDDLFCVVNVLEDIPNFEYIEKDAIDLALAVLLSNYNDFFIDDEQRQELINDFLADGYSVFYEENKGYWLPVTDGKPAPLMAIIENN